MSGWRQFVMRLERHDPLMVEEILIRHGAEALTLTDAGDEPLLEPAPGETPLWTNITMTALFSEKADFERIRTDLRASLGRDCLPANHVEVLADRAWEREWQKDYRPQRFGARLVVAPHGFRIHTPDAVVVRLDPGLAFGSGTHATTRLCLEALVATDLTSLSMLDFGCGSGILSIAALKLGAERATAIDFDHQARIATRQNALANRVEDSLVIGAEIDRLSEQFDIVVANILATTLIDHAMSICDRLIPGGTLILSGILTPQMADVRRAFDDRVSFASPVCYDGWARLTATRF